MKILQVHNAYRARGGEDVVLDLELDLLQSRGHGVERFVVSNESLTNATFRTGLETVWSNRSFKRLRQELRERNPDLVHIHNTFPQLSPSIYWAANAEDIPVVQTLHNYRLVCANGLLMRNGRPCEECIGRLPISALLHRSYRNSLAATGAVVGMQGIHRAIGTYRNKVNAYIVLTQFAKSVMIRSGLPAEKVSVKPNFIPDPTEQLGKFAQRQERVIFVGRLAPEKGVDLLLKAWSRLSSTNDKQLVIVGDGPERAKLENLYKGLHRVEWRGLLDREQVFREMAVSRYVALPSNVYEGFPMAVVEAFSLGVPVIAPSHAAFPEAIIPGSNGFLFSPGNAEDLSRVLDQALNTEEDMWQRWSRNARRFYLEDYTPEVNYPQLMTVYEKALNDAQSRS